MIQFDYLYKGVCGLAHAHRAGTMAGHLGAAVAAGYFFGEDQPELPERVYRGIEGELKRVMAGEEAIWFNAKKAGVTPQDLFEPFPDAEPVADRIPTLVESLSKNVNQTRQSGHNVIFASIAVRALQDHDTFATPAIVSGIQKLIAGFNQAPPGRGYLGKEKGWLKGNGIKPPAEDPLPAYDSIQSMVDVTVTQLIETVSIHRQGFGGWWHLINHTAAITELDRYGFKEVARQAIGAHREHLRLWLALPDLEDELGPVVKSAHDPREAVYWDGMLKRDQARLTHRVKTLYGFYTIHRLIEDAATRAKAEDALLYLMA